MHTNIFLILMSWTDFRSIAYKLRDTLLNLCLFETCQLALGYPFPRLVVLDVFYMTKAKRNDHLKVMLFKLLKKLILFKLLNIIGPQQE